MTMQENQDLWQEYLESETTDDTLSLWKGMTPKHPTQEDMAKNIATERHKRLINTVRHLNTPLENYEFKIANIAEQDCKTPAQWQNEEAEDIRINALGAMKYRSAGECLELCQDKLQRAYTNEKRVQTEIDKYLAIIQDKEQIIKELSNTGYKNRLRSANNKLEHAKGCIVVLECELSKQEPKTQRYERLIMKWTGINEKLKLAHIKQEIRAEKAGIGNKYGYNPKAQSRETAEIMFQD